MTRRLTVLSLFLLISFMGSAQQTPSQAGPTGVFRADITNTVGTPLPSKIVLEPKENVGQTVTIPAPKGTAEAKVPPGKYRAFVSVYDWDLPIVVAVKEIEIKPNDQEYMIENVPEASSTKRKLRDFDLDHDLVLDRVEEEIGTDAKDPASYPGAVPIPFEDVVLSDKPGWYRGDLHVRSKHGGGQESVGDLIKRAEKAGLDFIAITDRDTVEACKDPAIRSSKKVVVIPAMEWGDDKNGVALIYGPRTIPELTEDRIDAQGVVYRVQGQGGVFAIGHPCFPTSPWQRGLSYVNAIEVWCRSWSDVPPLALENLAKELTFRDKNGKLVYALALAASTARLSANGQAEMFWDIEMNRGLKAAPIGGSLSSSPKVPMGQPVTYVYAEKKSVAGILDGLRRGRTYVTRSPDGPKVTFQADVLANGTIDVNISGIIPVGADTQFYVNVLGAKNKKVELLENGRPAVTKVIESDNFLMRTVRRPNGRSVYRVRVTDAPAKRGPDAFTDLEVLALTGAIYAEEILFLKEGTDPLDLWVRIQNKTLPPLYIDPSQRSPDGRPIVHVDKNAPSPYEGQFTPPPGEPVKTIQPQWQY
ncbi:MAG TPA: CehA/McbA family metallohydrolase [Candidatus Hydrogenedentes bacterium]|nr:CehA/McbA family metallohydrolase [Candidatus Hydrogenedentota bacterium]HOL76457.1 CehA/McbA family metallohydrolase [Candidatus Hydrogenedentota bacterium]HPO85496.1 CehA/McbA family metallohydrolase [Candidatus Hydrogenedentota bacterium]